MNPTFTSFPLSALSLALLGLANPAWSQTAPAPNAGQVLRDLQLAPATLTPPVPLQRIDETPDLAQAGEATVTIKAIRIAGNTEVATPR